MENYQYLFGNVIKDKGEVTTDFWTTEKILLIKMKDGSYALGVNVDFVLENDMRCYETRRIKLNEDGVPYIVISGEHDFTPDNCDSSIKSFNSSNGYGYNHTVDRAYPILTRDDGMVMEEKSVFAFVGSCVDENVRENFSAYYKSTDLSKKGLARLIQYVEDPANKDKLDERTKKPSSKEKANVQSEIKHTLDLFFEGKASEYKLKEMIRIYGEIEKSNGLIPDGVIDLNLDEITFGKAKGE